MNQAATQTEGVQMYTIWKVCHIGFSNHKSKEKKQKFPITQKRALATNICSPKLSNTECTSLWHLSLPNPVEVAAVVNTGPVNIINITFFND